jgi:hypothetical protein
MVKRLLVASYQGKSVHLVIRSEGSSATIELVLAPFLSFSSKVLEEWNGQIK